MYIQQRQGKVSEATAKHFMQQLGFTLLFFFFLFFILLSLLSSCLCFSCRITHPSYISSFAAEGLKILRDNNLIHRDLKPQVCIKSYLYFYAFPRLWFSQFPNSSYNELHGLVKFCHIFYDFASRSLLFPPTTPLPFSFQFTSSI